MTNRPILSLVAAALAVIATSAYAQVPPEVRPETVGTLTQLDTGGDNWANVGPEFFEDRLGETFSIMTSENTVLDLTLAEVIAGPDDPNRPAFLARKRGVRAVFEASDEVMAQLSRASSQSVSAWHGELGQGDVWMGLTPENGDLVIEFVLN